MNSKDNGLKNIRKPSLFVNNKTAQRFKKGYEHFSTEVPIAGFQESIRASSWIIRVIWIILIILGLALTIYFVYLVAEDYLNEPTATKVSKNKY